MKSDLFRDKALDKLASPEQLDLMMQVTTSRGWVALGTIGVILILAGIWSVMGEIPTKVKGQGILLKSGGVLDIVPLTTGQVTDMLVQAGDVVHKDQVVARIAQPSLIAEIRKAEARLSEVRTQHDEMVKFGQHEIALQHEYLTKQTDNMHYSIKTTEEQLHWLEEKMTTQDELLTKGLITKQTFLNTKQNFYSTQEALERYKNELNQIVIEELSLKNRKEQERLNGQITINDAQRRLESLRADLALNSNIVSPYSGRILEILSDKGSLVVKGNPILRLDLIGDEIHPLEVVLYVSPADGKKIRPGMGIQIEPATVKREEFGFMFGEVTRVAEFPSTQEGMMKVLKNTQLVHQWSGRGAPFEVYARLMPDDDSVSGYKWSSDNGPALQVHSGTICQSSIVVRTQNPISMVIPLLKEYTGI